MTDWQPIETAPKDGTPILVWIDDHVAEVEWDEDGWIGVWEDISSSSGDDYPTHWMPLPEPPKVEEPAK